MPLGLHSSSIFPSFFHRQEHLNTRFNIVYKLPMRTGVFEMSNRLMIPKFCFVSSIQTVPCSEQPQLSRHLDLRISAKTIVQSPLKRSSSINDIFDSLPLLDSGVCPNIDMFSMPSMDMRDKVEGLDLLGKVGYSDKSFVTSMDTDAQYPKRMCPNRGLRLRVLEEDEGYPCITTL